MSFWSIWIFLLTLLFIGWFYRLFRQLERENNTANFDHAVAEFDGIEERDAPLPPWVIKSFISIFIFLAAFLILMPGVYRGIISTQEDLTPAANDSHQLAATIAALQGDKTVSLLELAHDSDIRKAGQNLFETHCASCHGMDAEGNKSFPNLVDDNWVYGDSDESLLFTLTHGRSYAMPGYENILSYEDIENVRKYLFSLNPERPLEATRIEIDQGQIVYQESSCPVCHGADAKGYGLFGGYNLTDNIWVYGGDVSDVRYSITQGHLGEMPAFKDRLDNAEIQAVAAYVRLLGQQKNDQLAALDPELLERGKYLAAAGDCVSCHSGQGGEPFGGGLPFATPFGTMYSTNISPSRTFGIGAFSYQHFYNALKKGHTRKGFLFPAMPFTSFQHIYDDDIEALWTYLQSLTPVHKPNQPLEMIFPTNVRLGQLGWQTLFMDKDELDYPQHRSESWQRGKYLTWGLGHCSECHTPRNFIMAMKTDHPFQGAIMEGLQAPDITATELYRGGWTVDDLHDFLKQGQSRKGTPFGVMADVVKNSTRYLTDADVRAIATYLTEGDVNNELDTSIPPIAAQGIPESHSETGSDESNEQYQVYIRTCGNCHGADGRGVYGGPPPLLNNGILTHSDPRNLIAVSLRGVSPSFMTPDTHFQYMSGFERMLTDGELAKLLSYVRSHLGGQSEPITRKQVKKVREYLEDNHFDTPIHGHSTAEEQPEEVPKATPLDQYSDY